MNDWPRLCRKLLCGDDVKANASTSGKLTTLKIIRALAQNSRNGAFFMVNSERATKRTKQLDLLIQGIAFIPFLYYICSVNDRPTWIAIDRSKIENSTEQKRLGVARRHSPFVRWLSDLATKIPLEIARTRCLFFQRTLSDWKVVSVFLGDGSRNFFPTTSIMLSTTILP